MKDSIIDIASDFSPYVYGRTKGDHGDYSGESFLNELLYPKYIEAYENKGKLIINLDGLINFSSSFFSASFGGLVKKPDVDSGWLEKNLVIISKLDPSLEKQIHIQIDKALASMEK